MKFGSRFALKIPARNNSPNKLHRKTIIVNTLQTRNRAINRSYKRKKMTNQLVFIYTSLFVLIGSEISAVSGSTFSESINGVTENVGGLGNIGPAEGKEGQKMGSLVRVIPNDPESAIFDVVNQEPMIVNNNAKSIKNRLLTQQQFPFLIASNFARLPNGQLQSKYLMKPQRELIIDNSLLNRGDETLRARRYSYPMSNPGFLRFGRRFKRPRDRETKDTAFLRFGRSGAVSSELDSKNSADTGALP